MYLLSMSASLPPPKYQQSWRILWLAALFRSCCRQTSMKGHRCCTPSMRLVAAALRQPPWGKTIKVLVEGSTLQNFSKSVPLLYLEMPLQQFILMEVSGGQILSKCRSARSVRRSQPLTSSSRRYGDPLVRYCTAISVIWSGVEENRKKLQLELNSASSEITINS